MKFKWNILLKSITINFIDLSRWDAYYSLLQTSDLRKIRPDPVLQNKLDLDQQKTLKEIKKVIDDAENDKI